MGDNRFLKTTHPEYKLGIIELGRVGMNVLEVNWYETPKSITIALEPEHVGISPLGNDAVIKMEINGIRYEALVPTWTLGEDHSTVPAVEVGRNGDTVVVYFPVSNEGRATWEIKEEDLKGILAS